MMTSREAYEAECQKRIRGEGAATANLWDLWQAACEWQKQRDAEICKDEAVFAAKQAREGGSSFDDGREAGSLYCAEAILKGDE